MQKKYNWMKNESITQFAIRCLPENPTGKDIVDVFKEIEKKIAIWPSNLTAKRKHEIVEFCAYITAKNLLRRFETEIYKAFPAPPMFLILGEKIIKELPNEFSPEDLTHNMNDSSKQEAERLFESIKCVPGNKFISFSDLTQSQATIQIPNSNSPNYKEQIEKLRLYCYRLIQVGGTILVKIQIQEKRYQLMGFMSASGTWEPISKNLLKDVVEDVADNKKYYENKTYLLRDMEYVEMQRFDI